jgi:hypothetical protein
MGAPFTLNGTADWGDLPKRAADVFLTPGDGRTGLAALPVQLPLLPLSPAEPEQAPNGSFRVGTVPGRYYVVPRFSVGFYPTSVLLGGREVLGQQVYLASGSPPIQVFYKPALGCIQGKVDNAASTVIVIPDQVVSIGFGRAERPKADGTIEIVGLPPGSYVLAGSHRNGSTNENRSERARESGIQRHTRESGPDRGRERYADGSSVVAMRAPALTGGAPAGSGAAAGSGELQRVRRAAAVRRRRMWVDLSWPTPLPR